MICFTSWFVIGDAELLLPVVLTGLNHVTALKEFGHGGVMYGWRARIGNISPTTCAEILPYEFYRVAPEGVTFVSTNLVIRDARESSQVEASWQKFDTAFEDLLHTRVDHITLSGAPLVLANGVERHRELLQEFRNRYPVPVGTSPQSFA